MRRIFMMGRILVAFFPSAYFAGSFCRDLFIHTGNKILFLVWAFPCLYLVINSMQLIIMLTGRQYRKAEEISVVKTFSIAICKFFPSLTRFSRLFFALKINDRDRIVSGIFWQRPTSIVIYKDAFDRMKVFSIGNLLIKLLWIGANLAILGILKIIIL
ncbi:hypothetical protein GXP67_10510 [Rhodocytophaga rosea]|uniref:Uncharacterized protein n=1 Tax=Rhodocytophaga rosea TaxID=2704465 RepID=A0A6C0GGG6_9BACT|nr:hypothetical protein [Rhodocytophaga rosea]QHT67047.1 hypothetical protein GXP67_10510 [Rhodocytophaga rosea]